MKNLFAIAELRLLAQRVGATRVDHGPQGGRIEFEEQASADPEALIALIAGSDGACRMDGPRVLRLRQAREEAEARFRAVSEILQSLQPQ